MRPLAIYLDTSDYSVLAAAPTGSKLEALRTYLLQLIDAGHIVVGASFFVIFELVQVAEAKHKDERLARIRLLHGLCRDWAFPHISEFTDSTTIHSDGTWYPRDSFAKIDIDQHVRAFMADFAREVKPFLSREDRRFFRKPRGFEAFLRRYPAFLKAANDEAPHSI